MSPVARDHQFQGTTYGHLHPLQREVQPPVLITSQTLGNQFGISSNKPPVLKAKHKLYRGRRWFINMGLPFKWPTFPLTASQKSRCAFFSVHHFHRAIVPPIAAALGQAVERISWAQLGRFMKKWTDWWNLWTDSWCKWWWKWLIWCVYDGRGQACFYVIDGNMG